MIGPYGLGLIEDVEAIEALAEISVVLLLFTIGLEFSLRRIAEMRRMVLLGGGLQVAATMPKVAGRFDLFDAWAGGENPRRAQIARGQELFNNPNAGGRSCNSCHNSANNGTNFDDRLFDVRTASAEARTPDLPLYRFKLRGSDPEVFKLLTDAGRGNITGSWADLGRFKTPTLRGLAARAPYFHDGIAPTLDAVVRHYEIHFGFEYTPS